MIRQPPHQSHLPRRLGRPFRAVAAPLLVAALLAAAGCANLEPVRDFGRTAASITAFSEAGAVYLESAVASEPYVRAAPAGFVAEPAGLVPPAPARARQVRAARLQQAALARYFALLARLAGDAAFDLDPQVDALGKALASVDAGVPKTTADASLALVRALVRWQTSAAQLDAVRGLVGDGGPPAMVLLDALRATAADWQREIGQDAAQVDGTLETLALPGDVPPLLRLLAADRRAALHRDDLDRARRLRAAIAALAKIRAAHDDLASHLDELGGASALRERLTRTAAELRALPGGPRGFAEPALLPEADR